MMKYHTLKMKKNRLIWIKDSMNFDNNRNFNDNSTTVLKSYKKPSYMSKSNKYLIVSFITSLLCVILVFDARSQGFEMGDLEDLKGKLEKVERGETRGEIETEDPYIIDKDRSLEMERDESMSD